VTDHFESLL